MLYINAQVVYNTCTKKIKNKEKPENKKTVGPNQEVRSIY